MLLNSHKDMWQSTEKLYGLGFRGVLGESQFMVIEFGTSPSFMGWVNGLLGFLQHSQVSSVILPAG